MSGAEDRDDFDNTTSVREFHASLRSFAFIKSQARLGTSPNLQRTDGAQNVGRKRPLSSDEPDVEVYFKPPTSHSPFPNPTKKKKWRGYAAPETYAHLRVLQDVLTEGLDGTLPCMYPSTALRNGYRKSKHSSFLRYQVSFEARFPMYVF